MRKEEIDKEVNENRERVNEWKESRVWKRETRKKNLKKKIEKAIESRRQNIRKEIKQQEKIHKRVRGTGKRFLEKKGLGKR